MNRIFLSVARLFTVLGAGMWIGGLAFFGAVAAPIISRVDRSLLFVLIAPMLSRFSVVTYVCGGLMLLGWLMERYVARGVARRCLPVWWAQGACTVVMLTIALYLGQVLMPQIKELQRDLRKPSTIIGLLEDRLLKKRGDAAGESRTEFDLAHNRYSQMSQVTVYLGLATLFLFCWRVSRRDDDLSSEMALESDSLQPSRPRL
jgi:putative copper export protein